MMNEEVISVFVVDLKLDKLSSIVDSIDNQIILTAQEQKLASDGVN